ncbi:MAG: NnrU family protein [Deltaproteobacteria bacterium]|nr:NnrU family protein [Deltaproteobacteria bacterium]
MASLLLACLVFLAIHVVISGSPLRAALVQASGERRYLAAFSLLSIGVLAWVIVAYAGAHATADIWWTAPDWMRWPGLAALAVALWLVVVGLTTPSPTATGGEARLQHADAVRGVLRVTRHPFLNGVALWAAVHLVLNGDAASVLLFGTMLALALIGPPLIDAKRRRAFGAAWERFAGATSTLPFAAIAAGRNQFRADEIGVWRWLLALLVYVAVLAGHRWAFGVSPLPR